MFALAKVEWLLWGDLSRSDYDESRPGAAVRQWPLSGGSLTTFFGCADKFGALFSAVMKHRMYD